MKLAEAYEFVRKDKEGKPLPDAEQIEYLQKLVASQNAALDQMQKERNMWRDRATTAELACKHAEEAYYIQKNIAKNLIDCSNETQQDAAASIHLLEAEVKELKG